MPSLPTNSAKETITNNIGQEILKGDCNAICNFSEILTTLIKSKRCSLIKSKM